jgi:hypothetical protein
MMQSIETKDYNAGSMFDINGLLESSRPDLSASQKVYAPWTRAAGPILRGDAVESTTTSDRQELDLA